MPENDLPKEYEIAGEVTPTRAAILAPGRFANAARIVHDQHTFTIYFFAAPADLPELEESKKQIRAQFAAQTSDQKGARPVVKLTAELEPVAKLVLPAEVMQPLMQAMAFNFAKWAHTFEEDDHGSSSDSH